MDSKNRMYSLMFPVWLMLIYPWVWFVILPLNFIIDSLVLILIFFIFKLDNKRTLYFRTVFKAWIFSVLASLVGFAFMWVAFFLNSVLDSPEIINRICMAISLNPFSDVLGFIWVVLSILISGLIIYMLNYRLTFNITEFTKRYRHRAAVITALLTAPYTFLIPTIIFK